MTEPKREWVFMTDETFYGEIRDVNTFDLIAVMPELDDRPEDFQLIATAPKLLEALEYVLEQIGRNEWIDTRYLDELIAKARGE